jgi:nitrate reductase NapAB chaperone NapD
MCLGGNATGMQDERLVQEPLETVQEQDGILVISGVYGYQATQSTSRLCEQSGYDVTNEERNKQEQR